MKDLNFQNAIGSVNVTFRTDLPTLPSYTAGDFTVHSITGVDIPTGVLQSSDFSGKTANTYRDKLIVAAFLKLPYNLTSFISFAQTNKLQLTCTDTNGANQVILARMYHQARSASGSDSGS